jgi:hypothetical protein
MRPRFSGISRAKKSEQLCRSRPSIGRPQGWRWARPRLRRLTALTPSARRSLRAGMRSVGDRAIRRARLVERVTAGFDQFVMPVGVAMGGNLENAQPNERADTHPEIKAAPPASGCDGTPSGYPTHSDLPQLVFVANVAFLVGFKIAASMPRRRTKWWLQLLPLRFAGVFRLAETKPITIANLGC